jgi:4'-phosphopantetheinyl transferase
VSLRWLLVRDRAGAELERWLTPEELAEGCRFRHPGRRRQWLLGRVAAKRLAGESLGNPAAVRVRRGPQGAPWLADPAGRPQPLALSLAHAEGLALAVTAPGAATRLGADLERVEPRGVAFLEDHYTPAERRWLDGLAPAERPLAACVAWTVKEAVLKALGVGLGAPADSVSVGPCALAPSGEFQPVPVRLAGGAAAEAAWRLAPGGEFVLALARLAPA